MESQIDDLKVFVENSPWLKKLHENAFGIILPNGWLGRPFDNHHSLNVITVFSDHLKIVFDDIREIEIVNPKLFEIRVLGPDCSSLRFSGNREVILRWTPYGEEDTAKTAVTRFSSLNGNAIELVGYFPAPT